MNYSDPAYYLNTDVPLPTRSESFARISDQDLIADIFMPRDEVRHGGAVLFLHGGGWKGGHRCGFRWHAHRLSLRGYLACTIDYRLVPAALFPAALDDCRTALDWLIERAKEFQIQPDRIGVVGSSAGGHLAACLGVVDPTRNPPRPPRVRCVVDVHGLHDLPLMGNHPNAALCEAFIGGSRIEKQELWELASPVRHVNSDATPMLITHDPNDQAVPYIQSANLVDALCRAGRPVQFIPTLDSGHGFFYSPAAPWTQTLWPIVVEWLDRFLIR